MFRRNHARAAAKRRPATRRYTPYSLYRRALRIEPLEDRRLLAVVTVDTLSDVVDATDNFTSLREAINETNLAAGADTIKFAPSLTADGPASIVLTQGQLKITDALAVEGLGASLLTIDASGGDPTPGVRDGKGSRLFEIDDGTSAQIVVSLDAVRLTGADRNDIIAGEFVDKAGAIYSLEDLRLSNVILDGNAGDNFILRSASLSLDQCQVSNNRAATSVVLASFLTINDSEVKNNQGAYIVQAAGTASISETTISDNVGTAIQTAATTDIQRSTISSNTGDFGGIWLLGKGKLNLSDSLLSDNRSLSVLGGGGIYLGATTGDAIIQGCTFIHNSAGKGGAIAGYGKITIRNSDFTENVATGLSGGGAIFLGSPQTTSLLISGCSFRQNTAHRNGGALSITSSNANSTAAIENSVFDSNTTDTDGGGAFISFVGSVAISDSVFKQNAAHRGAGLWIATPTTSSTAILDSTFDSNAAFLYGGGIYAGGRLTLSGSTISGNTGKGAGLFFYKATAEVSNSTISGNSAQSSSGGGIYNDESQLVIRSSTITGNTAAAGKGGGVAFRGNNTRTLTSIGGSIVAANIGGDVDLPTLNPGNLIQSNGYNVVGTGTALSSFNQDGDQTSVTNPFLAPLAFNGGPTKTHALLPGSPAINAGDPGLILGSAGIATHDQRGAPHIRIYGGRIDIGAVEVQPDVLLGDYAADGVVDAADYLVWQQALGSTTDLRADGDGNGIVDEADYTVWRVNFGETRALALSSSSKLDDARTAFMPASRPTIDSPRSAVAGHRALTARTPIASELDLLLALEVNSHSGQKEADDEEFANRHLDSSDSNAAIDCALAKFSHEAVSIEFH